MLWTFHLSGHYLTCVIYLCCFQHYSRFCVTGIGDWPHAVNPQQHNLCDFQVNRTSFLDRPLLSSSQLWDAVCVKCSPLLSPRLTQVMCSSWNLAWYRRQEGTVGLKLMIMRFSSGGFLLWTTQKHIDYFPLPGQNNPVYFFPASYFFSAGDIKERP